MSCSSHYHHHPKELGLHMSCSSHSSSHHHHYLKKTGVHMDCISNPHPYSFPPPSLHPTYPHHGTMPPLPVWANPPSLFHNPLHTQAYRLPPHRNSSCHNVTAKQAHPQTRASHSILLNPAFPRAPSRPPAPKVWP
mmetsp:Transcript_15984/g.43554  ORF Transcript_15984/g.43554 Transcript_15984/m.43554 type:complete len:136 (-) Transcript_15984:912-1319(-)